MSFFSLKNFFVISEDVRLIEHITSFSLFFGKFYEGGGKAFNPFKQITKYVEIKED